MAWNIWKRTFWPCMTCQDLCVLPARGLSSPSVSHWFSQEALPSPIHQEVPIEIFVGNSRS